MKLILLVLIAAVNLHCSLMKGMLLPQHPRWTVWDATYHPLGPQFTDLYIISLLQLCSVQQGVARSLCCVIWNPLAVQENGQVGGHVQSIFQLLGVMSHANYSKIWDLYALNAFTKSSVFVINFLVSRYEHALKRFLAVISGSFRKFGRFTCWLLPWHLTCCWKLSFHLICCKEYEERCFEIW